MPPAPRRRGRRARAERDGGLSPDASSACDRAHLRGKLQKSLELFEGPLRLAGMRGIRCALVTTARRIGLVLGAGGVIGHAYHAGVLDGLCEATGWDPRNA